MRYQPKKNMNLRRYLKTPYSRNKSGSHRSKVNDMTHGASRILAFILWLPNKGVHIFIKGDTFSYLF
jgi:hypothetical protein